MVTNGRVQITNIQFSQKVGRNIAQVGQGMVRERYNRSNTLLAQRADIIGVKGHAAGGENTRLNPVNFHNDLSPPHYTGLCLKIQRYFCVTANVTQMELEVQHR